MGKKIRKLSIACIVLALTFSGCATFASSNVFSERMTLGSAAANGDEEAPILNVEWENCTYVEMEEEKKTVWFGDEARGKLSLKEDNFSQENTKVWINVEDPETNGDENSEPEYSEMEVTWEEKGEGLYEADLVLPSLDSKLIYHVKVESEDKMGNKMEPVILDDICFDLLKPQVTFEYDNSQAITVEENKEYYDGPVELNMFVFDEELLPQMTKFRVKKDGEDEVFPFSEKTILSEDGEYNVTLTVVDKGGNEVTVGTEKTIVIDTKLENPVVLVNGSGKSGIAVKNELDLEVIFEEENLLEYETRILHSTVENPEMDVTGKLGGLVTEEEAGIRIDYPSFPREKEMDGTYTVWTRIGDKAGHVAERSFEFVVDRFGSSFAYGGYLNGVLEADQVMKELEEALTITEINPTKVAEDRVSVLITRDGKPVENPGFEAVTSRVNSWWKNVYTFARENFHGDGIYKVALVTEDSVGNIGELREPDNKAVQFRIDNTPPEIDDVHWKREDDFILLSCKAFDAYGISQLRVYKNGELFDEVIGQSENDTDMEKTFKMPDSMDDLKILLTVRDFAGNESSQEMQVSAFKIEEAPVIEEVLEAPLVLESEIFDGPSFPIWALIPGGFTIFFVILAFLKKSL